MTALKASSIDFERKLLRVTGALDNATRKETTPKSDNSAAPVHMPKLLAKHLRGWLDKHFVPNTDGFLFTNSKGKPYLSDNVVKYGVHRAMAKLGIVTAKGAPVGIHCFRHGVTSELLAEPCLSEHARGPKGRRFNIQNSVLDRVIGGWYTSGISTPRAWMIMTVHCPWLNIDWLGFLPILQRK